LSFFGDEFGSLASFLVDGPSHQTGAHTTPPGCQPLRDRRRLVPCGLTHDIDERSTSDS